MPLPPSSYYDSLAERVLRGETLSDDEALRLLDDHTLELLPLLHAAYRVRAHHFGNRVRIHILNNVQNGLCPEDCTYCAQSTSSKADIPRYREKNLEEILADAQRAHDAQAFRYCLVLSGRGPDPDRIARMTETVRAIKARFPLEVCLSAGFIDPAMASALKDAGLDRYNHNLNTAAGHYGRICSTHAYADRVATLHAARNVGLEVCSGIIAGMGEASADLVEMARTLRQLDARSIPVNFYVAVPGAQLGELNLMTPTRGLRILAMFRFLNPDAEIRAAGGREANLRHLQALALYPANSLFAEGYLNTPGDGAANVRRMIEDAGFDVEQGEHD